MSKIAGGINSLAAISTRMCHGQVSEIGGAGRRRLRRVFVRYLLGTPAHESSARAAEPKPKTPTTIKPITIQQLKKDCIVIGDLGKPIYETLTLEVTFDDSHKGESGEIVDVYSVNGVKLEKPERLEWKWCNTEHKTKFEKHKSYTVRAYQDGIVQVGYVPSEHPKYEFPTIRCFGPVDQAAKPEPLATDGGRSQVVVLDASSATTTGPILTPTLNIPFTQGGFSEPGDTSHFWFESKLVIYRIFEEK